MKVLKSILFATIFLTFYTNLFAQEILIDSIAKIPIFEEVNDVDTYGDYLFVNNELEFDITNPLYPDLYDSLFIDQDWYINPVNLEFFGDYCLYHTYTMEYENKLSLYNVEEMTSPQRYWNIISGDYVSDEWGQMGEGIMDMTIEGNFAYLALPIHHLSIISLADGTQSLYQLEEVPTYRSFGIDVENEIAYLACGEYGLHLIDVSDADNPFEISSYPDMTEARDITVQDGFAYICDVSELVIIDVSDPFTLNRVRRITTNEIIHKVAILDDLAFLCNGQSGVQVLNIENPYSPVIVQHIDIDGDARDISFSGDYAYIADSKGQLHIVNISEITTLTNLTSFGQRTNNADMAISGNFLIGLNSGKYPINIYDLENPYLSYSRPLFEGYLYHENDRIAASENCLYFLKNRSALYLYEMADPLDPEFSSIIDLGDERYNNLLVYGSSLFLLEGYGQMKVYNISDPLNPVVSGNFPDQISAGVEHSKVYDDVLFISARSSYQTFNLQWIDISDPSNPVFYPAFSEFEYIHDFAKKDDYLFIGHGEEAVTIVDISNRSLPVISGEITLENDESAINIEVIEDYLLAFVDVDGYMHLDVYDISDGSNPVFISRQEYSQISSSCYPLLRDNLFITQGRALTFTKFILPGYFPSSSEIQTMAGIPSEFGIAKAYPNPFNPTLNVEISLPTMGNLEVSVFNMLGQKVANLANQQFQPGNHTFTFDGSNLSSGVYFIRASLAGQANQLKKITLVK